MENQKLPSAKTTSNEPPSLRKVLKPILGVPDKSYCQKSHAGIPNRGTFVFVVEYRRPTYSLTTRTVAEPNRFTEAVLEELESGLVWTVRGELEDLVDVFYRASAIDWKYRSRIKHIDEIKVDKAYRRRLEERFSLFPDELFEKFGDQLRNDKPEAPRTVLRS
jgi:hypothetical protein